jgi:hypothetical protein
MLSIVFKWGSDPLLESVLAATPGGGGQSAIPSGAQIIDLTSSTDDFVQVSRIASRVLAIALDLPKDGGAEGTSTFIVSTLLNRHATDVLKPAVCLAWMPDRLKNNFPKTGLDLRQRALNLLSR